MTDDKGWTRVGDNAPETLLNDYYSDKRRTDDKNALTEFAFFDRLPAEIRCMIWRYALQPSNRIIGILLEDKDTPPDRYNNYAPVTSGSSRGPRNIYPAEVYRIGLTTTHRVPPLLTVCRESRNVAASFYRVHFPCDLHALGPKPCLYFNPELDYLHVKTRDGQRKLLAYFSSDFLSYDPRSVGIQNLVVSKWPSFVTDRSTLSSVPEPQITAFLSTITNLKNVIFRTRTHCCARFMMDLDFMRGPESQVRFNRSYPINVRSESFQILDHDPRSIDEDLKETFIISDPRGMFYAWACMDRRLGIDRSINMPSFRYLLTSTIEGKSMAPERPDVSTRSEAVSGYIDEQNYWQSRWENPDDAFEILAKLFPNPDTPETLRNAPLPAFGFWLLPLDALTEPDKIRGRSPRGIPRDPCESDDWSHKMIVDLRKYRPQLGLFDLT